MYHDLNICTIFKGGTYVSRLKGSRPGDQTVWQRNNQVVVKCIRRVEYFAQQKTSCPAIYYVNLDLLLMFLPRV